MNKSLVLAFVLAFGMSSTAMAAYEKCQGCHNGKTAPDKAQLTAKFKTAEDFVNAAKGSKSPMMASFQKNDADLKAAAGDLGLK